MGGGFWMLPFHVPVPEESWEQEHISCNTGFCIDCLMFVPAVIFTQARQSQELPDLPEVNATF